MNRHLVAARKCDSPFQGRKFSTTGNKRLGLVYEQQCKDFLKDLYGKSAVIGQWFAYQTDKDNRIYYCQPDAYVVLPKQQKVIIIESKLKHTIDSYLQIELLYLPVLKRILGPSYKYCAVEMVRLFDPTNPSFNFKHIQTLDEASPEIFGVFQWIK